MKKLLFGFVVLLGLSVNAKEVVAIETIAENATVITKSHSDDLLKGIITIDFGRKSKGCIGFGICSIKIEIDWPTDQIQFRGEANSSGNLYLEVTKLGVENVNKTFGFNGIILEEDFQISNEVCKQLGLKEGYTIKAGKYEIKTTRTGVNYMTF